MSWLFMIIPEFYNDVGNDMFYYFTLTNQTCHTLYVLTIAKSGFFLCFFSSAMWQHGYTETLVAI